MLKLIALTGVLVAGLSSAAYAGGATGDARNHTPPTKVKGTSSQSFPHHNGLPKCHSMTTDSGQVIEICAAQ